MHKFSKQIKVSVMFGFLAAVVGLIIPILEPNGDTHAAINLAQSKINELMSDVGKPSTFGPEWITVAPSWKDVEKATETLNWTNSQTAEAKAMLRAPDACPPSEKYKKPCSSFAWDNRFEYAARPWQVEERIDQYFRALYTSVASFLVATLLMFIALLLLTYFWYFVLARIAELAEAIRGK